jgi:hypothetical protein
MVSNKRQRKKEETRCMRYARMKVYVISMGVNRIPKSIWCHRAKRMLRGIW